ncbi:hypothetical protein RSOLAG22IIIB_11771 [Rhizoctonia solani]|uniref:Transmembrane protein n=1 Tax=Rhizoctonia solani TaxID=456999 RepID=A0A0K6GAI9_9AGAM|nr:hypothetical protein RSOLAG22IIIB_11771 [Rhizoctonia solani]
MFVFVVAVVLFVASAIAVPWTNATCVAEPWSFNTHTQSPCLVASSLCAACTTDNTCDIYSLRETGGGPYNMPPAAASNCVCNSVMWNLLSACALCQKQPTGTWAQWVTSCPNNMITVGKYPAPIPVDVTVPSWAYYDFTNTGVFNAVIASQQSGPESSAVSGATNTLAPAPVPTAVRDPSPTSTETETMGDTPTTKPVKPQSESGPTTGAIIGAVVGGVLGIGLMALIAFVLTRNRKPQDPSLKYPEASHKPPMTAQFNPASPMTGQAPPYQFNAPNQPVPTPEYKPYDPNDPSTFPTDLVVPANGYHVESIPYSYHSQGTPGQQPYPTAPQV